VLTRCSQLHGRRNGELALDRTDDNGNRHIIRCFSSIGAFPINWKRFIEAIFSAGQGRWWLAGQGFLKDSNSGKSRFPIRGR